MFVWIGWVGGWVGCGWMEEEAFGMSYCELGVKWVGGWVGGWFTFFLLRGMGVRLR